MRVIVNDTSCLIDLRKARILTSALLLPYRFQVALPLVRTELLDFTPAEVGDLVSRGLDIVDLSGAEVQRALALRAVHPSLSINDCFSLALAEREADSVLLTGDAELRRRASAAGVEVHGVLWVTDEMEAHDAATFQMLLDALEHLAADPVVFLPPAELAKRIRRLRDLLGL